MQFLPESSKIFGLDLNDLVWKVPDIKNVIKKIETSDCEAVSITVNYRASGNHALKVDLHDTADDATDFSVTQNYAFDGTAGAWIYADTFLNVANNIAKKL
jgi:hypothetical protein